MRSLGRQVAAGVCSLLVVCGCAAARDDAPRGASASPSPSAPPSSADADPGPLKVPATDPPPCQLVRAGIDAFNLGSPASTVRLFERALPIARQDARAHPSRNSRLLLEAVEYYATLPAGDYAKAMASSPEFKRHQTVTLTLCRYGAGPSSSPSAPTQTT